LWLKSKRQSTAKSTITVTLKLTLFKIRFIEKVESNLKHHWKRLNDGKNRITKNRK